MTLALRRHADAEAFLADAIEALEVEETANNLILGVPLRQRMQPDRAFPDAYFATVHAQGRLVGAALRTPPYNLVVHIEESAAAESEAIVALLLEDALIGAGDLSGVVGRVPWSQTFADAWSLRTGRRAWLGTRLRAFELRAVIPPPPAAGDLRRRWPLRRPSGMNPWAMTRGGLTQSTFSTSYQQAKSTSGRMRGSLSAWWPRAGPCPTA